MNLPNDIIENTIKQIVKNGYAEIDNYFNEFKSKILKDQINDIFNTRDIEDINKSESDFSLKKNIYGRLHTTVTGQTKELDEIINEIINNPSICEILDKLIGKNRKLYSLNVRRAGKSSNFVGVHTDGLGNVFSFSILINNHYNDTPTTCVVPKSHKSFMKLEDKIEWLPTKYISFLLKPFIGKSGKIMFFDNNIWHGMQNGNTEGTAIIFCFLAEGAEVERLHNIGKSTYYNQSYKNNFTEKFFDLIDINKNIENRKIIYSNSKKPLIYNRKKSLSYIDLIGFMFYLSHYFKIIWLASKLKGIFKKSK